MLFPDLALARRLELHEAWSSSEHARVQAQLYPETGAVSLPIGNGRLVYCGRKSPLSQVYGWGLPGPVVPGELEAIETFYRSRELSSHIQVCPLADPSLFRLLAECRYTVQDSMNVYARPVNPLVDESIPVPGLSIEIATPEDARLWFEMNGASGDWTEPDGLAFMLIRTTLKSDTRLFLARFDGQLAGGGALEIHDGVAALMAADTLAAFRNHGIHTALLHARLVAAHKAGCDLAVVHTRPGTVPQRNVLRASFQFAYNVVTMRSSGE
jgi:hypothetical protein